MFGVIGRSAALLSPLLLCLAVSSKALAGRDCPDLPSDLKVERISIDRVEEEIASAAEITRLSGTGDARAPHPLMAIRYSFDSTVGVLHGFVSSASGGFCDAPERVIFRFGLSRRRVLLTPEAAAEPCVKSALLAHEAEHYRIAGDGILSFLDQHETELAEVLLQLKAKPAPSEDTAEKTMELGLMSAMVRLAKTFQSNEMGRIRELADSPTRLSDLGASCDGRIVELERGLNAKPL